MFAHYFAFGANMSRRRPLARLPDHRFLCNKAGSDGSCKANIEVAVGDEVWGVVFRIQRHLLPRLDRFEGGYERRTVEVELGEIELRCETYVSDRVLRPEAEVFDWYKQHMLVGAREHDLPALWLAKLEALPTRPGA